MASRPSRKVAQPTRAESAFDSIAAPGKGNFTLRTSRNFVDMSRRLERLAQKIGEIAAAVNVPAINRDIENNVAKELVKLLQRATPKRTDARNPLLHAAGSYHEKHDPRMDAGKITPGFDPPPGNLSRSWKYRVTKVTGSTKKVLNDQLFSTLGGTKSGFLGKGEIGRVIIYNDDPRNEKTAREARRRHDLLRAAMSKQRRSKKLIPNTFQGGSGGGSGGASFRERVAAERAAGFGELRDRITFAEAESLRLTDLGILQFLIGGTGPRPIRPSAGEKMGFYWARKASGARLSEVMHPGNKPNPFDRGIKAKQDALWKRLVRRVENRLQKAVDAAQTAAQ